MARDRPGERAEQVDSGEARLVPDPDRAAAYTLLLDGTPQSYVDLDDPTRLEFGYVRRIAAMLDAVAPSGERLRVLHLGGGGLTLPRYVAATRRGSPQRVVERDAALTALVRRVLPLPRGADVRVRHGDARAAVESMAAGRFHVVITDVYSGGQVPARFTTTEFAAAVARTLVPGGHYAVNIADSRPLRFARGQVATLRQVFAEVCLVAESAVLRGRRYGNLVLVAVTAPGRLPLGALSVQAARDALPARLVHGAGLDRFAAGVRPVRDADAVDSPQPPRGLFLLGRPPRGG